MERLKIDRHNKTPLEAVHKSVINRLAHIPYDDSLWVSGESC